MEFGEALAALGFVQKISFQIRLCPNSKKSSRSTHTKLPQKNKNTVPSNPCTTKTRAVQVLKRAFFLGCLYTVANQKASAERVDVENVFSPTVGIVTLYKMISS